jgi:CheY-like chemotaxis protein
MPPRVQQFFSLYQERGEASSAFHVVNLNLEQIHREVHNEHRFEQVSVVVVDYDMPELNGLEFCRNIKNPAIKKILLTGKADEQIAVSAFNDRIIDRFIRKQDADVMNLLDRTITELQHEYFNQIEHMLSNALAVGSHLFLFDELFAAQFEKIRIELGIVEHYLSCMPEGILMLDMYGTAYLLVVQTEEAQRSCYEIAFDQEAPDELLAQLRSGKAVPYFWETGGNYSPSYADWRSHLHPATEFKGKDWYLYSVIKHPAAFNLKYVVPYGDFLGRLDEEEKANRASLTV